MADFMEQSKLSQKLTEKVKYLLVIHRRNHTKHNQTWGKMHFQKNFEGVVEKMGQTIEDTDENIERRIKKYFNSLKNGRLRRNFFKRKRKSKHIWGLKRKG